MPDENTENHECECVDPLGWKYNAEEHEFIRCEQCKGYVPDLETLHERLNRWLMERGKLSPAIEEEWG